MKSAIKTIAGVFIAVLLVGAIGTVIYLRVAHIAPNLKQIQQECIDVYVSLQDQGSIDEAYTGLTTEAFQKRYSLEEVTAANNERTRNLGRRVFHEMVKERSPLYEYEGASYQLHYRMQYENGSELMAFEVVPTDTGYRINATHTEVRPGHLQAAPW